MAAYRTHVVTLTTASGTKTATITPATGDLFVVFVGNSGDTGSPTVTDDNGSGTYTEITSAVAVASADRTSVHIRTALVPNTTSTIVSMAPGTTTGGGLVVVAISGMTLFGSSASRQTQVADNQTGTAAPSLVFPANADSSNLTFGMIWQDTALPTNLAAPTNWTRRVTSVYSTPSVRYHVSTRDSGMSDDTITWPTGTSQPWCGIILELDTSAGAVAAVPYINRMPQLLAH